MQNFALFHKFSFDENISFVLYFYNFNTRGIENIIILYSNLLLVSPGCFSPNDSVPTFQSEMIQFHYDSVRNDSVQDNSFRDDSVQDDSVRVISIPRQISPRHFSPETIQSEMIQFRMFQSRMF